MLSLLQPLLKIHNLWSGVCMSGRNCLCSKYTKRLIINFRQPISVCFWLFVRIQSFLEGRAQIQQLSQLCLSVSAQNLENFKKIWSGRDVRCLCSNVYSKGSKMHFSTKDVCSLFKALYIHKSPCQLCICYLSTSIYSKALKYIPVIITRHACSSLFEASEDPKDSTPSSCLPAP